MIYQDIKIPIPYDKAPLYRIKLTKNNKISVQTRLIYLEPEVSVFPYDKYKLVTLGYACKDNLDFMNPNDNFRKYFPHEFDAGLKDREAQAQTTQAKSAATASTDSNG